MSAGGGSAEEFDGYIKSERTKVNPIEYRIVVS
jgi:hypothetical protein